MLIIPFSTLETAISDVDDDVHYDSEVSSERRGFTELCMCLETGRERSPSDLQLWRTSSSFLGAFSSDISRRGELRTSLFSSDEP